MFPITVLPDCITTSYELIHDCHCYDLLKYSVVFFSAEPTSVPLDLFVEDKNDTSVSIIWSQPENIGPSGLDGYTIEICKDGSKPCSAPYTGMCKNRVT